MFAHAGLLVNFEMQGTYVGDGNSFAGVTEILQHVLNQDGSLSDGALWLELAECARSRERSGYSPTVTSTPSELVRVIAFWSVAIVEDWGVAEGKL